MVQCSTKELVEKVVKEEEFLMAMKNAKDLVVSDVVPILCGMLVEYDLFNKVLHMYTVGNEEG